EREIIAMASETSMIILNLQQLCLYTSRRFKEQFVKWVRLLAFVLSNSTSSEYPRRKEHGYEIS
ncbi:MAG: hypothetical protein AB8B48_21895, partial [Pseudomonadales bacterium]